VSSRQEAVASPRQGKAGESKTRNGEADIDRGVESERKVSRGEHQVHARHPLDPPPRRQRLPPRGNPFLSFLGSDNLLHYKSIHSLLQICTETKTILSVDDILALIGDRCDGVIGQASKAIAIQ
jgi:hypothetical protein